MAPTRGLLLTVFAAALLTAPGSAQSSSFGNSVVIDGETLIISEPNNTFRPGLVYLYQKASGEWTESGRLAAPDSERADGFGAALALSGNALFVAQRGGRVHIFERDGTGWRATGLLDDDGRVGLDPRCNAYGYCSSEFGITLAADGNWLLIGEPRAQTDQSRLRPRRRRGQENEPPPPAGSVFAYERTGDGWTLRQELQAPDFAPGDGFGGALHLDGDLALIGAPNAASNGMDGAGRVFAYQRTAGGWALTGELTADAEAGATFGGSIEADGDRVLVGAPGSGLGFGATYLFAREGDGSWAPPTRLAAPDAAEGDVFGTAVAFGGDDLWVGAPVVRGLETGMVFVYPGGPDAEPLRIRFTEDQTNNEDSFGHRIASNHRIAAVTASGLDHQAGGVFVYERDAQGGWRQTDRIVSAPDALGAVLGEERRCTDGAVELFDCDAIELLAYVPISLLAAPEDSRGIRTNDNWGWTDSETGREYALVGRNDGTAFIDITDPVNPVLIGDLPKTPGTPRTQLWRDIKTYKDHAFIVADGAGAHGMQVFDLSRLREVDDPPAKFEPDLLYRGDGLNAVESSHNIIINEETGFAYLTSRRCAGMHVVNIEEPLNPVFVGCSDPGSTHDAQCILYQGPDDRYVDREICLRMSGDRFQISDVTDKDNYVELSTASHPNPAYMHQGWVTEDHRYFIMDDESDVIAGNVDRTRTLIWDLTDLEDPVLANEFMGSLPASAHNLYVKGDYTYQANYRYGLHILDTSDPMNPREVGRFDTSPYQTGPGFSGAWSTYPFFESGTIIVTSLQEGLFVLKKRPRPVS